jgi:hypothetical protein
MAFDNVEKQSAEIGDIKVSWCKPKLESKGDLISEINA